MYSVDGIYRGGCWFCPKQCNADLYSLWKNYPEYFQKLVDLEPYSPHNKFKPDGNPSDYAKRFEAGYVPVRRKKREKYVQMSIFDFLAVAAPCRRANELMAREEGIAATSGEEEK